ncbi:MAG: DNA polymerase III subunit gamma/tau [Desulfopila sp.]
MSYLVLARKSRPQTFAEVVGQQPVVKTLQNSLRRKRVAHAILFSGVRGVGKTTLARIMAKAINCEAQAENPPCNACPSCREITAGSALDLIEIDGASNRGIQEIRELKEKIKFLPTSCKYKIIIIDEVHMLTTEAFNALLKTLEEPPEHVYFMFATTELHKIPITILSRCQRYELRRVSAAELTSHFRNLADQEGVHIEQPALSLIVREAEGSVRDGLSLLDQVFSFGEKNITRQDVTEVLGLVDRDTLWQLSEALLQGNRTAALQSLADVFSFGMDIRRFSTDLLECFRILMLCRIDGCDTLLDLPAEELARCRELAGRFSFETIHLTLNLLMRLIEDIRHSSQPRLALETSFLNIIETGNVVPVTDLLGKLEQLMDGQRPAAPPRPAPPGPPPAAPSSTKTTATTSEAETQTTSLDQQPPAAQKKTAVETAPADDDQGLVPGESDRREPPVVPKESPSSTPETMQTESSPALRPVPRTGGDQPSSAAKEPQRGKEIRRNWPEFIAYVKERSMWMAQDLNRTRVREKDDTLLLHYDDPAECSLLRRAEHKKQLTEFALDFFQKELRVQFILPETEENPDDKNGLDSPQQKRQQLAHDPLTIMTAEIFHGQVGDIRIGPRSR